MRFGRVLVAATLVMQVAVAMAGEPFEVRITAAPTRIPLGIPADVMVKVRNVSGAPVPVGFTRPPLAVLIESEAGSETFCSFCRARWGVIRRVLPADWQHHEILEVPLRRPGVYTLRAVLKHHWNVSEKPARYPDLWWSRSVSKSVEVEITQPEGIDREAYEAFDGTPLDLWPSLGKEAPEPNELLRRFPESTYAAYVVWKRYAKGWAATELKYLFAMFRNGLKHENGYTPCDREGNPDALAETMLRGRAYVACRDAWLEMALESHPDIWFADEIRLRLALDRYIVHDVEGFESALEDLAEHGREDVAAKARELLSAMRAKGMLPARAGAGASAAAPAGGQRP